MLCVSTRLERGFGARCGSGSVGASYFLSGVGPSLLLVLLQQYHVAVRPVSSSLCVWQQCARDNPSCVLLLETTLPLYTAV